MKPQELVLVPKYRYAKPFDLVRTVQGNVSDIKALQIQSPAQVRKSLNLITAALNPNPFFWGGDSTGWVATNGTFAVVSDPPAGASFGYAGLYTNNGSAVGYVAESNSTFKASPIQQYQVTCLVYSASGSVVLGFNWYNAFLGTVTGPTNPTISVTANTWTTISATIAAPLGTAIGCPLIGPSAADGSTLYIQAITVIPVAIPGAWTDLRSLLLNSFTAGGAGQYPPQCRLTPDGEVEVYGTIKLPTTYTGVPWGTLPVGYRPLTYTIQVTLFAIESNGTSTLQTTPSMTIDTGGNMQLRNMPTGLATTIMFIHTRFPLDSSGLILT
jgi:hypothetical protein